MTRKTKKAPLHKTAPLDVAEQTRLRAILLAEGDFRVAERIGVGSHSLARAAAGLPVRPSVLTAIRLALAAEVKP